MAAADDRQDYLERASAQKRRLVETLPDAAAHQRRVLNETRPPGAASAFGREHGFERIGGVDDFRAAVPIRAYDELERWIVRAAGGEPQVLTGEDPLVFFGSSGSTGAVKQIPITAGFIREVYMPFLYATYAGVFERYPEVLLRDDATLNLKYDPGAKRSVTASGRPHIGASQLDFGGVSDIPTEPGTRAPWSSLPPELEAGDTFARLYNRVRLAAEHDLRCVVGINPAQVAALPWLLERWWPEIVGEIRDGTLAGSPARPPNPDRADELERLAGWFGTLLPAHVWPHVDLIVCWN